jgi:hypothetical protein
MSLKDWERNGWVIPHSPSANEIRDLLSVVERDLADSAAENLSADWRMNIAYNARDKREQTHGAAQGLK